MRRRRVLLIGGGLAATLALASGLLVGWHRAPPWPRLVVLYAPCSVNRNFLAPYNRAVTYTPHLATFAQDGLVFTKHETEEGLSGIAYAALLSGNQAMRHGAYTHPVRLDKDVYQITEAFRDSGYDVFYWADHDMASPALNYGAGVDPDKTYWNPHRVRSNRTQTGAILRGDDPRLRHVLETLRDHPSSKAFLLTMFKVTHMPYSDLHVGEFCAAFPTECAGLSDEDIRTTAALLSEHTWDLGYAFADTVATLGLSAEEVARVIRGAELLYKSNVFFLDQLFGGTLAAIKEYGLVDESLIAFTADHGELLYRQNAPFHWTHGYMLAPEDIIVPLILRGPGVPPGRYESVTRSIDVFPTLASLAGVRVREPLMGVDLSAALRGDTRAPELTAFSHTGLLPALAAQFWPPQLVARMRRNTPDEMSVAARRGDLVYKVTSDDGTNFHAHVYNWETDPSESTDLYDPQDETQRAMLSQLGEYRNALSEGFARRQAVSGRHIPTDREQDQLRALGYIK